jgi:hypothetical protein
LKMQRNLEKTQQFEKCLLRSIRNPPRSQPPTRRT